MNNNKLKLNGDKTHLILLSTDKAWKTKLNQNSITLQTGPGEEPISTTNCENLLGGFISQNLKWTNHILLNEKSLVKQLGTRLNALKKISRVADFKTRKMLADGLFMSKLIYLIPLWGGCEKFLIKALQIIQNKAARTVSKLGIFTPVKVFLKQCGWLSVHQLVFFHTVVLLFKTRQNKTPKYLYEMASTELPYRTRAENPGKLRAVAEYIPVFCLPSTKIVVTMFACHLHSSDQSCVLRVTFKHLPQPLRSHIRSFGTISSKKQLKKT
jgi:hypothetical protein